MKEIHCCINCGCYDPYKRRCSERAGQISEPCTTECRSWNPSERFQEVAGAECLKHEKYGDMRQMMQKNGKKSEFWL